MNSFRCMARSLTLLSLFCASCRGESEPVVTSYVVDGKLDEDAVVADVQAEIEALSKGIQQNDADLIFGIFSTTKKTTYVRDGKIEKSVEEARESYARALAQLKDKRGFSFEQKQFDIIDAKTVLFTGLGVVTAPGTDPWRIAYTILFSLEEGGYKALNMHISWSKS